MKNIILIGMPGCGKTTVAKELVSLLFGVSVVDIDEEIVKSEKRSINDIFEKDGEDYFRRLETEILKKYQNTNNLIISTGGGIVEREKNIELMKQIGFVFYLYSDINTLYERVKTDSSRPLLKVENVKERLETLYNRRDKKYRMADFIIDTTNLTPNETARNIIKESGYGRN